MNKKILSVRKTLAIIGFFAFMILWIIFKVMVLNSDKLLIDAFVIAIAFGIAWAFYRKKIEDDPVENIPLEKIIWGLIIISALTFGGLYFTSQQKINTENELALKREHSLSEIQKLNIELTSNLADCNLFGPMINDGSIMFRHKEFHHLSYPSDLKLAIFNLSFSQTIDNQSEYFDKCNNSIPSKMLSIYYNEPKTFITALKLKPDSDTNQVKEIFKKINEEHRQLLQSEQKLKQIKENR